MEAVFFVFDFDLKSMTWSGKSQGNLYCLAAGNPVIRIVVRRG